LPLDGSAKHDIRNAAKTAAQNKLEFNLHGPAFQQAAEGITQSQMAGSNESRV